MISSNPSTKAWLSSNMLGSGDMNMGDHITSLTCSGLVSVLVSPRLTSEQYGTLVSLKEQVVG